MFQGNVSDVWISAITKREEQRNMIATEAGLDGSFFLIRTFAANSRVVLIRDKYECQSSPTSIKVTLFHKVDVGVKAADARGSVFCAYFLVKSQILRKLSSTKFTERKL